MTTSNKKGAKKSTPSNFIVYPQPRLILERPINYVEISESNFNTYSNTYTMLLQTIGSEMNVVFKELCCFDKSDKKSIKDFSNKILSHYPEIRNQEIEAMGYGITFKPFESWNLD